MYEGVGNAFGKHLTLTLCHSHTGKILNVDATYVENMFEEKKTGVLYFRH